MQGTRPLRKAGVRVGVMEVVEGLPQQLANGGDDVPQVDSP
jgi:hypothetical protein